jgi:hypothetical protein
VYSLSISNVEILIALSYRKGCIRSEQLVAEDLGQEDVVGLVSGFELVAADSSVGASEVAGFPGFVQRAEGVGNVLRQLRAGGGVDGIGALEGFEIPESVEGLDDFFWIGQNRDWVRLEAGAGGMAGFELALEDEGGEGEFLGRQAELCAKEDFGRPAPGERHQAHAFFEVAVAGQEVESFFYEGLRVQWDQVGLVLVDALVVGRVKRRFCGVSSRPERERGRGRQDRLRAGRCDPGRPGRGRRG